MYLVSFDFYCLQNVGVNLYICWINIQNATLRGWRCGTAPIWVVRRQMVKRNGAQIWCESIRQGPFWGCSNRLGSPAIPWAYVNCRFITMITSVLHRMRYRDSWSQSTTPSKLVGFKFILTTFDLHTASMFVCACVCGLEVPYLRRHFLFLWCNSPIWASASSGRVISWSQRPLPDNAQQTQQNTSIPSAGYVPTIPAIKRP